MKHLTSYCQHKTHLSNLLFETPEALAQAIVVHGDGLGSTVGHTARAMSDGLGAMLFLADTGQRDGPTFAKGVAAQALRAITEGHDPYDTGRISHMYRGDWDHWVPGPFHKTSIHADPIDTPNGTRYLLSISAAYVGNKPEITLAKNLDMENGIGRIEIERGWETETNRWTIPYADIAEIYKAFDQEVPSLEEFFQRVVNSNKKDQWEDDYVPTTILETDTITVSLGLVKYSILPHYEARNKPGIDITVKTTDEGIEGPAREVIRYKSRMVEREVREPSRHVQLHGRADEWILDRMLDHGYYEDLDDEGNRYHSGRRTEMVQEEVTYRAGYEPVRMELNIRAKEEWLRHDPTVKAEMHALAGKAALAWPAFGKGPYED